MILANMAAKTTDPTTDTGGIVVSNVTVTYRNGHTALYDASFDIPRGTITALVGVNGAGKSTLFKAIMGFVPAAQGDITLLGKSVKQALRENLVAYVPQSEEVDWAFPVLVQDVVMMGRYGHMGFLRRPKAADHAAVADALRRVNMTDYRHRQIGELSGGQRKRVFLARALAQDGKVILLDEPFTGVDVKTEDQMKAGSCWCPLTTSAQCPSSVIGPSWSRARCWPMGQPKPSLPMTIWKALSAASCVNSPLAGLICTMTMTVGSSALSPTTNVRSCITGNA